MMKNKIYIYVATLFLVSLFGSCITNKQKTYLQDDSKNRTYEIEPYKQYRLCMNDEVSMYLMTSSAETQYLYNAGMAGIQAGNMGSTFNVFRIYDNGCVVLPTVGSIKIAGMTLREAETAITKAYKEAVVEDAEVKLALTNNYFYVQGDQGKGQFFMYKEKMTIFQALAMAGDLSSVGDKRNVKIIRKGVDGVDEIKTLDLRKESIVESEYYYIYPNDVIYISTNSNSFFRIDSVSSFISLFVAPISLLVTVITLFKN